MNFFEWIRSGVSRAVLLGVSDAVEQIGTPADDDDMSQRLLEVLRTGDSGAGPKRLGSSPKRKKLGRTLLQIQAGPQGAS